LQGVELYRELRKKTTLITDLFGTNLLTFYITSVCYYAEAPHVLLGKRGNTDRAMMIYFATTTIIWILGAEFHKNVYKVEEIFSDDYMQR